MRLVILGAVLSAGGLGGCAQSPQQVAAASHGKEYFPSSVYGAASRRVIADGQPIPRGGGQYLVGKPYVVAGQTYYPSERKIVQVGNASWYGDAFHGRLTANGEIYDRDGFTAAHPTMPLPSYARVTNLRNNASMIVRVNDRGPYASSRVMDVSRRVAEALDFKRSGTAKIKVEYVGRASLDGSEDAKLYATLRTDGPARWQGEPAMAASEQPAPRFAALSPNASAQRALHAEERRAERIAAADAVPIMRPSRRGPGEIQRPATIREAVSRERTERQVASSEHHGQAPRPPIRLVSAMPHLPMHDLLPREGQGRTFAKRGGAREIIPPARPVDLATIRGADTQAGTRHRASDLRLARAPEG